MFVNQTITFEKESNAKNSLFLNRDGVRCLKWMILEDYFLLPLLLLFHF